MIEYDFNIRHEGCWTEAFNVSFPEAVVSTIHSYNTPKIHSSLIEIHNIENNEVNEVQEWLSDHSVIQKAHLVEYEEKKDLMIVNITCSYNRDQIQSVHQVLLENECVPILPSKIQEGREYWSVLAKTQQQASETYEQICKLGQIEIEMLAERNFSNPSFRFREIKQAVNDLTDREREVLLLALENGYYSMPRGCNLEELAAKDDANFSTIGEHLRRIEWKVFSAIQPIVADLTE
jgi:predicted DNA binding protein